HGAHCKYQTHFISPVKLRVLYSITESDASFQAVSSYPYAGFTLTVLCTTWPLGGSRLFRPTVHRGAETRCTPRTTMPPSEPETSAAGRRGASAERHSAAEGPIAPDRRLPLALRPPRFARGPAGTVLQSPPQPASTASPGAPVCATQSEPTF